MDGKMLLGFFGPPACKALYYFLNSLGFAPFANEDSILRLYDSEILDSDCRYKPFLCQNQRPFRIDGMDIACPDILIFIFFQNLIKTVPTPYI